VLVQIPPRPGEVRLRSVFLEDPDELRVYEEVWSALQASALSADDSQAFLESTSFGYNCVEVAAASPMPWQSATPRTLPARRSS